MMNFYQLQLNTKNLNTFFLNKNLIYMVFYNNCFSWILAFAELQTDMTDLTADLESSGIPTLDHNEYILKVFFPGVRDHPILNESKVSNYNI